MTLSTLRNRLRDDRGSALVELLVAIPATLAVGGAAMALFGVFSREEQVATERTRAVEAQQVATNQITRDVRQASAATVLGGGYGIRLQTYVFQSGAKVAAAVTYDCSTGACRRLVGDATSGPAVISGVRNPASVFSMTADNHVSVSLRLDDASVVDGAQLVNAP